MFFGENGDLKPMKINLKNKTIITTLTLFIVSALFISLLKTDESSEPYQITRIQFNRDTVAENYHKLRESSDLIIKGRVLEGKSNRLMIEDGTVLFGYTSTNIEVTDVIKGEINKGDIITITEEYWATLSYEGIDYWSQGSYYPARVNREYYFFLKAYSDPFYKNKYFPIDLEMGKYRADLQILSLRSLPHISNRELEIGKDDHRTYRNFFLKVILNKY